MATGLPADVVSARFEPREFDELVAAWLLDKEDENERQEWLLKNFAQMASELRNIQVLLVNALGDGPPEKLTKPGDFIEGKVHQMQPASIDAMQQRVAAALGPTNGE